MRLGRCRPGKPAHELEQPARVAQGRAVTKAGQPRFQLGQARRRAPVHGGVDEKILCGSSSFRRPVQIWMLARTSPRTSTRSCSRQNETWPSVWPGVSSTRKPPTSSPSRSCRDTGCGGPTQCGPTAEREPVAGHPGHDLACGFHRQCVGRATPAAAAPAARRSRDWRLGGPGGRASRRAPSNAPASCRMILRRANRVPESTSTPPIT